jgi:hypothetical protein
MWAVIQQILNLFSAKNNLQAAQIDMFNHSSALGFLLYYLIITMIFNDFANRFDWTPFVTQLNPVQTIVSIAALAGIKHITRAK